MLSQSGSSRFFPAVQRGGRRSAVGASDNSNSPQSPSASVSPLFPSTSPVKATSLPKRYVIMCGGRHVGTVSDAEDISKTITDHVAKEKIPHANFSATAYDKKGITVSVEKYQAGIGSGKAYDPHSTVFIHSDSKSPTVPTLPALA